MKRFGQAKRTGWIVCAAALAAACGAEPEDLELTTKDQDVIGGTQTTARPEVGQIFVTVNGTPLSCTATLISRRYFLTAAHCIGYLSRFDPAIQAWAGARFG